MNGEEQALFETLGLFTLANSLVACASLAGLGVIGLLAVRPKTRNPGLLFAALGFAFFACANIGFAAQFVTALAIGYETEDVFVTLDWLNRMQCAFSVAALMGVVSLILAFTYAYRRFLPSWREIIIDEGDGPF